MQFREQFGPIPWRFGGRLSVGKEMTRNRVCARCASYGTWCILFNMGCCVQVESYGPAMIEPILDSMRHFTKMAFDILTFLFLERFTKDKRGKVKVGPIGLPTVQHLTHSHLFVLNCRSEQCHCRACGSLEFDG